MARKYTSLTEVENYLLIDVDDSFQDQVESWIEYMTEYIEQETGRVFEADSEASEKTFEVKDRRELSVGGAVAAVKELLINECAGTGVTKLVIDDDEIDEGDYLLYPMNEDPKTRIVLTSDSGLSFTEDEQNIVVTAHWGYSSEVPSDIKFVCTVLVAGIINNSWSHEGELASITMGRYSASFKTESQVKDFETAKEILKKYKKINL
jgi:hypothetical protein